MIKRTRFSKSARASLARLVKRTEYLSNAEHKNHTGKLMHRPAFHGCVAGTVEAFLLKLFELYERYRDSRRQKRGKKTKKLFEEFVYSSPEFANLTAAERRLVEEELISRVFHNVPVMTAWHEDPRNGRSDLHMLIGDYTDADFPLVFTSASYGHGGKNIILELERVEAEILKMLNRKRDVERQLLSAREVRRRALEKAGVKTVGQKLAKSWDGRRATLKKALEKLGYIVRHITDQTVTLAKNASSRGRRYVIETLNQTRLQELAEAAPSLVRRQKRDIEGPSI